MEKLFRQKTTKSGLYRALLLYYHGGAYIDFDTISRKQIPEDIPNFIQSSESEK